MNERLIALIKEHGHSAWMLNAKIICESFASAGNGESERVRDVIEPNFESVQKW